VANPWKPNFLTIIDILAGYDAFDRQMSPVKRRQFTPKRAKIKEEKGLIQAE